MCVVGSCLLFCTILESLASTLLCSKVGQERAEAKVDPDTS